MIKESPLQFDFEKLWKEGMLDWHGKMPERMIDDELEEAFWAQSMKKKHTSKQMTMQKNLRKNETAYPAKFNLY